MIGKAGESQGRAPGRASDYTLRAPNPLDSRTHDQTFYQDFGPPNGQFVDLGDNISRSKTDIKIL